MKKLYELFNLKQVKGDVGIEIECEGDNLVCVEDGGWKTVDDGSLRGNFPESRCEWVLEKPIDINDVLPAMQYLEDRQKNATLEFSFRTSVHLHINVQQLTANQILNMFYTYFLCETVLMNYCAEHRRGNRFCLRMEDAEGIEPFIRKMIITKDVQWKGIPPNDAVRYAAMNIEAMWKYGSLEFRGMEGNLSPERINTWAKAFVNIRSFAKKFDNIQKIHDFFVKNSPNMFFDSVFQDVAETFKYPGFANDLRKGFSLTIDFPYALLPDVVVNRKEEDLINIDPAVQMHEILNRGIVNIPLDGIRPVVQF